jgi:hypothetical protein
MKALRGRAGLRDKQRADEKGMAREFDDAHFTLAICSRDLHGSAFQQRDALRRDAKNRGALSRRASYGFIRMSIAQVCRLQQLSTCNAGHQGPVSF